MEGNNTEMAETGGNPCRGPEGSGQMKCPYNVVVSLRTSLFYTQGGKFYLNSRCIRCYVSRSRGGREKALNRPREPDGTQLCRLRLGCANVDLGYRAGCQSRIRKHTERTADWDRQSIPRTVFFFFSINSTECAAANTDLLFCNTDLDKSTTTPPFVR
jgi:hypothetical protein